MAKRKKRKILISSGLHNDGSKPEVKTEEKKQDEKRSAKIALLFLFLVFFPAMYWGIQKMSASKDTKKHPSPASVAGEVDDQNSGGLP